MPGSNREIVAGSHDGFNSVRAAARPTSLQKIEFDVTTAEGRAVLNRIWHTTCARGRGIFRQHNFAAQNFSVSALVDPTLTPGQFRKATAIAAFAGTDANVSALPSGPNFD